MPPCENTLSCGGAGTSVGIGNEIACQNLHQPGDKKSVIISYVSGIGIFGEILNSSWTELYFSSVK